MVLGRLLSKKNRNNEPVAQKEALKGEDAMPLSLMKASTIEEDSPMEPIPFSDYPLPEWIDKSTSKRLHEEIPTATDAKDQVSLNAPSIP